MTEELKKKGSKGLRRVDDFNIFEYIPFQLTSTQIKLIGPLRVEATQSMSSIAELTKTEFRVFVMAASCESMTPTDLAQEWGFDRAIVARAISSLKAKSLITTEPLASDLRSKAVRLTKKGEQMRDAAFGIMFEYGAQLDKALTKTEKAALFRTLAKLREIRPHLEEK